MKTSKQSLKYLLSLWYNLQQEPQKKQHILSILNGGHQSQNYKDKDKNQSKTNDTSTTYNTLEQFLIFHEETKIKRLTINSKVYDLNYKQHNNSDCNSNGQIQHNETNSCNSNDPLLFIPPRREKVLNQEEKKILSYQKQIYPLLKYIQNMQFGQPDKHFHDLFDDLTLSIRQKTFSNQDEVQEKIEDINNYLKYHEKQQEYRKQQFQGLVNQVQIQLNYLIFQIIHLERYRIFFDVSYNYKRKCQKQLILQKNQNIKDKHRKYSKDYPHIWEESEANKKRHRSEKQIRMDYSPPKADSSSSQSPIQISNKTKSFQNEYM